jgi:hypothetical protein
MFDAKFFELAAFAWAMFRTFTEIHTNKLKRSLSCESLCAVRIPILLILALGCLPIFSAPLVTTNLLLNPGGEANNLADWVAGGNSGPRLDSGTFDTGIKPRSGTNDFLAGTGSVGSLSQIVPLVGNQGITAGAIDAGSLQAYVSFWEQGLNQSDPSDNAYISVAFLGATSNSISTWASPVIDDHFGSWSNYSTYLPIPATARFIQYSMNFVRNSGNDLDAFIDDNVLSVANGVQIPMLKMSGSATNALLYWPAPYADGFVLVQKTNLTATNWTVVSTTVTNLNGTNQVSVSPLLKSQFFRLYHP